MVYLKQVPHHPPNFSDQLYVNYAIGHDARAMKVVVGEVVEGNSNNRQLAVSKRKFSTSSIVMCPKESMVEPSVVADEEDLDVAVRHRSVTDGCA